MAGASTMSRTEPWRRSPQMKKPRTMPGLLARALERGEAPPHVKHQDRYTVRSGACVTNKAKDLPAVMVERFGDVAGFVGRPSIAAAE